MRESGANVPEAKICTIEPKPLHRAEFFYDFNGKKEDDVKRKFFMVLIETENGIEKHEFEDIENAKAFLEQRIIEGITSKNNISFLECREIRFRLDFDYEFRVE